MRDYYEEFRKAEKLGEQFVRDLFHVFLDEIESEKDVEGVNNLYDDIIYCAVSPSSDKEAQRIYEEIADEWVCWVREKCVIDDDYDEVVSFKGE